MTSTAIRFSEREDTARGLTCGFIGCDRTTDAHFYCQGHRKQIERRGLELLSPLGVRLETVPPRDEHLSSRQ